MYFGKRFRDEDRGMLMDAVFWIGTMSGNITASMIATALCGKKSLSTLPPPRMTPLETVPSETVLNGSSDSSAIVARLSTNRPFG
jgi:hypothetical protein